MERNILNALPFISTPDGCTAITDDPPLLPPLPPPPPSLNRQRHQFDPWASIRPPSIACQSSCTAPRFHRRTKPSALYVSLNSKTKRRLRCCQNVPMHFIPSALTSGLLPSRVAHSVEQSFIHKIESHRAFIVNIGDMMERWTNCLFRFPPITHRGLLARASQGHKLFAVRMAYNMRNEEYPT
ncbi:hypothetical protein NE237_003207 [Protea cynaroides]|uniref:Uncharacterized protein n=1 Tax=Protea cynaroides TaxID=273540 RepID=A0A9Q0QSC9_9MAGN|nr:hypothetical protein NE237_003207 [Protea cynaroides]